jgi:hypothetical protein
MEIRRIYDDLRSIYESGTKVLEEGGCNTTNLRNVGEKFATELRNE